MLESLQELEEKGLDGAGESKKRKKKARRKKKSKKKEESDVEDEATAEVIDTEEPVIT